MKQFVQTLNEAGFAACVILAIILAFFLMIANVVLEIAIGKPSQRFSGKIVRNKKDLVPYPGQLTRLGDPQN